MKNTESLPQYDLSERLLDFAHGIMQLSESMLDTRAGNHVAKQILRSGTSPLPNHGEAQAAESPKDFIHKLRICLKELRETFLWLQLIERADLVTENFELPKLITEADELIRIFVSSIRTAEKRL
ncbi:four helix bundle protein [Kiritimatiellota bacterium B12222]|nr:four helix bundle protein [Kiritimatiellota bacterium B12222]